MQPSLWAEAHMEYTLRWSGLFWSENWLSVTCHSFVSTSTFRLTDSIFILLPANFSEPEIKLAQNVTGNSGINLTCTSKQGHPKPKKMYFLITNSTNEYGDNMQISQDNVTELFSISNSLSLSFPDGVWHMTVVCVLETESMKISSKPLNFSKSAS
jgi:hypothetical protein